LQLKTAFISVTSETLGRKGGDAAFAEALMRSAIGTSEGMALQNGGLWSERRCSSTAFAQDRFRLDYT
jgi:hypothetical protein